MMAEVLRVYVAGPFRRGDQFVNVREAALVGIRLRRAGHVPVIPHCLGFVHYVHPMPDLFWLAWGLDELRSCHCLVRLPGESVGSDAEVELAKVLGMPVYYGVEAFLAAHGPKPVRVEDTIRELLEG